MSSHSSSTSRRARQLAGPDNRWERMFRVALVAGLALMALLYGSALVGIVGTTVDSSGSSKQLDQLKREHSALVAKQRKLQGPNGVEVEARRLGMVKPGEVPVVVTGLRSQGR